MAFPIIPLVQAGIGAIGGIVRAKQEQKELAGIRDEASAQMAAQQKAAKAAREGLPEYQVGRGAREAYMMSQQDLAGDIARREAQRGTGGALSALTGGGARALIGGASSVATAGSDAMSKILGEQYDRRTAGATEFAKTEQDVLQRNVEAGRDIGLFDYGRALGLGDEARAAMQTATGEIAQSKRDLTSDLFGVGSDILGTVGGGIFPQFAEDGAKVRETPGEFSHKTNPIDIVRQGAKIGEMTGGELIFNPEQAGKMERMAAEGDTELHRYMRGLFKKFNSKK